MGEHPTQGSARVVTENGKRYLVLDAAFKTDAGPDLFVLLHREAMPRTYDAQSYLSLGALQQVNGEQRYEIPTEVDLGTFKSAVIWCRQFSATFGYAPFQ
jgi:Electron transfer DM13